MAPLPGVNQEASSGVRMSNAGSLERGGCQYTLIIFTQEKYWGVWEREKAGRERSRMRVEE